MDLHYLEIVTPDVDAVCQTYSRILAASFGEPVAGLGQARTADLPNGGRVGVRAPMREDEEPIVRPYLLVEDIAESVEVAKICGAEIAHPPLEIPGQGKFAILIQGGIHHGLWQRD